MTTLPARIAERLRETWDVLRHGTSPVFMRGFVLGVGSEEDRHRPPAARTQDER